MAPIINVLGQTEGYAVLMTSVLSLAMVLIGGSLGFLTSTVISDGRRRKAATSRSSLSGLGKLLFSELKANRIKAFRLDDFLQKHSPDPEELQLAGRRRRWKPAGVRGNTAQHRERY
ncbi:hypothetical protein [Caulifigura coniformis]|uniref:hypothetical protein n=1 Tax=Caulifigura coniformis TaxID=2527983 RepID=UPI0011A2E05F|nr:hypothetical protein [Caulifigura coniformis]